MRFSAILNAIDKIGTDEVIAIQTLNIGTLLQCERMSKVLTPPN
jgi:hypothetical protein